MTRGWISQVSWIIGSLLDWDSRPEVKGLVLRSSSQCSQGGLGGGGRSNIGGGPQQPLPSMQWGCCWSSIIWNSEVNGARWKGNFSINFSLFNQKCWLSPLKTFRWKDDYFRFIKLLCSFWSFWTLEYLTTIFSEEWDFNWNFKLSYFKKGP